jgi:hypothetical protein
MDYTLSRHAKARMKERRVTIKEVEYTLRNFLMTYPSLLGGTTLVAYFENYQRLKVWVANVIPLQEPFFVKSVGRRESYATFTG